MNDALFIAATGMQTQQTNVDTIANNIALVDEAVGKKLPTSPDNLKNARATDAEFWIDHGEDLEERFIAWANK